MNKTDPHETLLLTDSEWFRFFKQAGALFMTQQECNFIDDEPDAEVPYFSHDGTCIVNPFIDDQGGTFQSDVLPFDYYPRADVQHWMHATANKLDCLGHLNTALAEQHHADKLFCCIWGEGYVASSGRDYAAVFEHPIDFFDIDNGYEQEHIQRVRRLEIGESCMFNECGFHTVVRVK